MEKEKEETGSGVYEGRGVKMDNVTHIEFGKEARDAARRYIRLRGLLDQREDDFLRDPVKFFDDAGETITRLMRQLQEIKNATHTPVQWQALAGHEPPNLDILSIDRADYERLKRIEALARNIEA